MVAGDTLRQAPTPGIVGDERRLDDVLIKSRADALMRRAVDMHGVVVCAAPDAGLRLLEQLRPGLVQIAGALEDLNRERALPVGHLRIYATHPAATAVIAPIWVRFLSTYPDINLELRVDETPIDIVAKGFDAGIGPRDRAASDMIAVRVMEPTRVAVVGAPTFFARLRPPRTPDDLAQHNCIKYRLGADGPLLHSAVKRNGKSQRISVEGRVIVSNGDLAVRPAAHGLGMAVTLQPCAELLLRSGQVVLGLEDW